MKTRQLLLCLTVLLTGTIAQGQKQANVWYFGNSAGVTFNSGNPVALLNGQTNAQEGTSVISDSSGALLFYSDGMMGFIPNRHSIRIKKQCA